MIRFWRNINTKSSQICSLLSLYLANADFKECRFFIPLLPYLKSWVKEMRAWALSVCWRAKVYHRYEGEDSQRLLGGPGLN